MDGGDKMEKWDIEKSYGWWECIGRKNEKMIILEIQYVAMKGMEVFKR